MWLLFKQCKADITCPLADWPHLGWGTRFFGGYNTLIKSNKMNSARSDINRVWFAGLDGYLCDIGSKDKTGLCLVLEWPSGWRSDDRGQVTVGGTWVSLSPVSNLLVKSFCSLSAAVHLAFTNCRWGPQQVQHTVRQEERSARGQYYKKVSRSDKGQALQCRVP